MANFNCSLDGYHPNSVYVLRGLEDHEVARRVRSSYPEASYEVVDSQQMDHELMQGASMGEIIDQAKKTLFLGKAQRFISQQKGQAVHYCKGPRKLIPISNGCGFSCEYCFLQGTYRGRHPRIKFNLNYQKMLDEIDADVSQRANLGTQVYHMGENQDSLAFDPLYPLTEILVPFVAERDARLLLLTKSDCVDNLVKLDHKGHTIVSWSLNSDWVTRHVEHDTAPLDKRLAAARRVQEAGYPLRLRFDPLLLLGEKEYNSGHWRRRYNKMMDSVFAAVKPERVTLGSLRYHPTIRSTALKRFPDSVIFDDHLLSPDLDEDHRYRYRDDIRMKLYGHIADGIRKRDDGAGIKVKIGLCKETEQMWESAGLKLDRKRPTCHCQL